MEQDSSVTSERPNDGQVHAKHGASPGTRDGGAIRRSVWLPRALFESALIVFSVLLALVLNEWRAEAKQRSRVNQALSAIRAEIQANRRLVADARQYHLKLVDSFSAAEDEGAETPDLEVVTRGLLAPAPVLRTAWNSTLESGLANGVQYETVLRLSGLYARQDQYDSVNRALSQELYGIVMREGFDSMIEEYTNFTSVIRDSANREQFLLDHYDRVLEELR